jgi:FMN-dependent NADH-azoreductase
MAKLLYVTCKLKPVEHSRSFIVGSEFLHEYLKWNPEDEIYSSASTVTISNVSTPMF